MRIISSLGLQSSNLRLMIVTDAWRPQVNGVARTYEWLSKALEGAAQVNLLTPEPFRRMRLPTYPEIELALASPAEVGRRIREARPDVVHIATEGPLGVIARRHCSHNNVPMTTCYHTRYPEYIEKRLPLPASWTYPLLRRFHWAARRTLVATRELGAELRAQGFRNVTHWRRGVDVKQFRDGEAEQLDLPRPRFLYVGRLAVEKNIDAFLDLDLPGSKMVVGDGPERARLVAKYPAATFFGAVNGARLGALYRAADCFVFPSRTDTFGLVIAEALAAGLPVACYPTSGAREIFGGEKCGAMRENLREAALEALEVSRSLCREIGSSHSLEASAASFLDNMLAAAAGLGVA